MGEEARRFSYRERPRGREEPVHAKAVSARQLYLQGETDGGSRWQDGLKLCHCTATDAVATVSKDTSITF